MVGERWKIGYIIEEKAGKYPKDRALGDGRHAMKVKIGYILKKKRGKCPKCSLRGSELKRKGK